ncbi:MAG: baseplate J/gp47 family protein [Oscillospiraceae bacterium]|nr:baseplate J/gp47 family protein [Oscillospiraceae bacterium]
MELLPKIDNRNYEDLLEDFKKFAKAYTPEWFFEENGDDFGVVLAKIFCEMQEGSINRLNRAVYNYYLTFLNIIGTFPKPAQPSSGFVTIEAVENFTEVCVKKGEKITANTSDGKDDVDFETCEDIYVVDSKIEKIFMVDPEKDLIVKVFDLKTDKKFKPFRLYGCSSYENLQTRWIYFEDNIIFNTKTTDLTFFFHNTFSAKTEEFLSDVFSSKDALWQYFDGKNWRDIDSVIKTEGYGINIKFDFKTQHSIFMGVKSRFLRCSPATKEDVYITGISYTMAPKTLKAEEFLSNENQLEEQEFLPFDEKFSSYDSFYIKSNEAFSKKNAHVEFFMDIEFFKIKSEEKAINLKYKLIMSDIDFAEIKPVDIVITSVSWEYWNGIGWAKLEIHGEQDPKNIFKAEKKEKKEKIKLSFVCPHDFQRITVGASEGLFVRVKITKVNNSFENSASYITPCVTSFSIVCFYKDYTPQLKKVYVYSNLESRSISFEENLSQGQIKILEAFQEKNLKMYFCFSKPLNSGIVKMLFEIEEGLRRKGFVFRWEYFAKNQEGKSGKWDYINVIDLTEGFFHSEIVSVMGRFDFQECKIFGESGYFIRVINTDGKLYEVEESSLPILKNIAINTVKILQRSTFEPEYFSIGKNEEKKVCQLSNKGVSELSVWVNEFGRLSTKERDSFVSSDNSKVEVEYNHLGLIEKIWVKWAPVNNILLMGPKDRVYEVNYSESKVIFGDGKNGKIPPEQYSEGIKIEYSTCAGEKGNITAGSVKDFVSVISGVSKVYNLKDFTGGVNVEKIGDAAERMFSRICSGGRMISAFDFKDLLISNIGSILKIKCLPHVDKFSKKSVGTVSIAVLPQNFPCGFERFNAMREQIINFIKQNASVVFVRNLSINVFEVQYVEIFVHIKATIKSYEDYQKVYVQLSERIKVFLNPARGNFSGNGWDIGTIPSEKSIRNYLKSITGMEWISKVTLFAKIMTENGKRDASFDEIQRMEYVVPIFGGTVLDLNV